MADVTLTGTLTGVGNKGPIGPLSLAHALQNMRSYVEGEFEVRAGDAARAIALPAEGTAQRLFLLCADGDFDFTINGGATVYGFRAGLPVATGSLPSAAFILPGTPLVTSFEVTSLGAVTVKGYWLRVVES